MAVERLKVTVRCRDLYEIAGDVAAIVEAVRIREGECTFYVRHSWPILAIQEDADPSDA